MAEPRFDITGRVVDPLSDERYERRMADKVYRNIENSKLKACLRQKPDKPVQDLEGANYQAIIRRTLKLRNYPCADIQENAREKLRIEFGLRTEEECQSYEEFDKLIQGKGFPFVSRLDTPSTR